MSQAFKVTLGSQDARRMLLELKAYAHSLPETLKIGAQHLITHMELKATEAERKKWRAEEPVAEAKGRLTRG